MKKIFLLLISVFAASIFANAEGPVKKTVREFLRMSPKDSTYCELTGIVSRVRNYEKGNLYLDDGTGSVLIYGVLDPKHRPFRDIDIREGDSLTVRGHRFVYDGRIIEMKNGRYVRHVEGPDHENMAKMDNLDKNPTFKGKDINEFSKWVTAHLVYPQEAKAAQIQGKVVVRFIVGRDGSVLEPKILESLHPAIDAEVLRVLKSAPKWKPGIVDGHPVRVTYTLPVFFALDEQ